MIKVNLLNSYTGGTSVVSPSGTVAPSRTEDMGGGSVYKAPRASSSAQVEAGLKIVGIFIPLILLIGYETYNTDQLKSEEAKVAAELTAAQSRIQSLKPQVEAVKQFQDNKAQLESKINVIRTISRERLKNVKALDALQNIMPPKCWLTELKIKGTMVSLKGLAIEDVDVSQLMAGLEESVYFAQVNLKGVESQRDKEGVLKKFDIEVFLENM
ncbi:MAG TPA: PilN domain-containing protein [Bdellovibrionales bacterium]|nr:PilN domain-containing protein [Bdellovibrionales bacterium]